MNEAVGVIHLPLGNTGSQTLGALLSEERFRAVVTIDWLCPR